MNRMIIFLGSFDNFEAPESRKCSTCPGVMLRMASRCSLVGSDCVVDVFDSFSGIVSVAILFMSRAVSVWFELVPLYR